MRVMISLGLILIAGILAFVLPFEVLPLKYDGAHWILRWWYSSVSLFGFPVCLLIIRKWMGGGSWLLVSGLWGAWLFLTSNLVLLVPEVILPTNNLNRYFVGYVWIVSLSLVVFCLMDWRDSKKKTGKPVSPPEQTATT